MEDDEEDNDGQSPPHKRQRPINEALKDLAPQRSLFDPNATTTTPVVLAPKAHLPDIPTINSLTENTTFKCIRNKDGSLLMYWLDATELNGEIFLFGKVKEANSDQFISCCVVVPKLWRTCHLLLPETDDPIDDDSLQEHVTKFVKSNQIAGSWRYKTVSKQYCFEEPGIPYGEHQYVELQYPLWEGDVRIFFSMY